MRQHMTCYYTERCYRNREIDIGCVFSAASVYTNHIRWKIPCDKHLSWWKAHLPDWCRSVSPVFFIWENCRDGDLRRTVNPLPSGFGGSNPSSLTHREAAELKSCIRSYTGRLFVATGWTGSNPVFPIRRHSQAVKTQGFQSWIAGSNPAGVIHNMFP